MSDDKQFRERMREWLNSSEKSTMDRVKSYALLIVVVVGLIGLTYFGLSVAVRDIVWFFEEDNTITVPQDSEPADYSADRRLFREIIDQYRREQEDPCHQACREHQQ